MFLCGSKTEWVWGQSLLWKLIENSYYFAVVFAPTLKWHAASLNSTNCFNILVVVCSSTKCVTPQSHVLRNRIVSPGRRSVSASARARRCWPIKWQTARQACLTAPSAGPEILELSAQETQRANENVGECNEKGLRETKQAVNAHCDCLLTYNQHIPFCSSASSFHKLACLQMFCIFIIFPSFKPCLSSSSYCLPLNPSFIPLFLCVFLSLSPLRQTDRLARASECLSARVASVDSIWQHCWSS